MKKQVKKNLRQRKLSSLFLATVFSVSLVQNAISAQTTSMDGDASIVTYDKEYFVKYSPVTLLDMLQRVPGVPEILNKNRQQRSSSGGASSRGERGFGSGGDQILIDGKRLAGKSNNINDALGRISASQVSKVELIRGATSGLDVQSQGLVINISLVEGSSSSTTFWQSKNELKLGHNLGAEFLLSHSGSKGNLEYMFSGERTANNNVTDRIENEFDATERLTGVKNVDALRKDRGFKLNTNLNYSFQDGGVLRLNGLYEPEEEFGDEYRIERGDEPEDILWQKNADKVKWEIGGDYTRRLGELGNLKVLFVVNRENEQEIVDRFTGAGTAEFQNVKDDENEIKKEKIFRASLITNLTEKQSLEFGGEAAINTFDKTYNQLERDLRIDPFVLDSSDNVEIKENRYELFANHSYNISNNMVLQSSLTTEFSKIVADNIFDDGSISRRDTNFTYLKPRMNLRYDFTDQDQLRLTVEKKVSQLDFNNFVTRFDQQTEEIKLGNTNIRPEQVWEFSAAFEHRLPNDTGSLEAEVFYRNYKDHITRVDFTEYEDFGGNPVDVDAFFALSPDIALRDMIDFTSKSGNVDKANAYGVKFVSNIRLGFVGMPQATLSASYTYERRRVIDQFTNLERQFQRTNDHQLDVNYRHDITEWDFSYGVRGTFRSEYLTSDVNYHWPYKRHAYLSTFLEYNIFKGVKMRVEAKQLSGKRATSDISWYNDHIRFNDFNKRVHRVENTPREVEVTLQGTF